MGHLTSQRVHRQEIEWRRSQVLQYSSQGYSIREIAQKLQIAKSSIDRDLQFLKQQARNHLQNHIHDVIPIEYEKCMIGMKHTLKQTLEIAEASSDPRIKLDAMKIANDCYKYIMDLTTNGAIITDAIKHVTQIQNDVNIINKVDKSLEASEEEITTNGIF
jgi:transcriptional regulator with PAS, ATPase and Fis domain